MVLLVRNVTQDLQLKRIIPVMIAHQSIIAKNVMIIKNSEDMLYV